MIKYTDQEGVSKIGSYIQANKTAIDGTLKTISQLNEQVSQIEINWGEVTGFAQRLEELVGCKI